MTNRCGMITSDEPNWWQKQMFENQWIRLSNGQKRLSIDQKWLSIGNKLLSMVENNFQLVVNDFQLVKDNFQLVKNFFLHSYTVKFGTMSILLLVVMETIYDLLDRLLITDFFCQKYILKEIYQLYLTKSIIKCLITGADDKYSFDHTLFRYTSIWL